MVESVVGDGVNMGCLTRLPSVIRLPSVAQYRRLSLYNYRAGGGGGSGLGRDPYEVPDMFMIRLLTLN